MTWVVVYREAYFNWYSRNPEPTEAEDNAFFDWTEKCAEHGPPNDGIPLPGPDDEHTYEAMIQPTRTIVTYLVKPFHRGIVVRKLD